MIPTCEAPSLLDSAGRSRWSLKEPGVGPVPPCSTADPTVWEGVVSTPMAVILLERVSRPCSWYGQLGS